VFHDEKFTIKFEEDTKSLYLTIAKKNK